jgi:hemerythrin-like domain-containing protein
MTIIDSLIVEHRVFLTLFDQVEQLVPGLQSLAEVQFMSNLMGNLLQDHIATEEGLTYRAMEHVVADKESLERSKHYHVDLVQRLNRIQKVTTAEAARSELLAVMQATREHINDEEQNIFPLMEAVLHESTLTALGEARLQQRAAAQNDIHKRVQRQNKNGHGNADGTRNETQQFAVAATPI